MTQALMPATVSDTALALPAGTRVAEFEVRRVLGSGGFGIVYLAWDHALEREVALKEYMPGTLAGRGSGLQVSVRSNAQADTYALGLRSFINEARLLARFDHPALVKVYRFWEDNGTAYMVMPHYPGRTLRQARHAMVVPPGDAACRRVLDALLSALEVLHREGVYHRDIAPDNILLGDDGQPVLLDFGAARRVLGDHTQALTSIMKPHYAPLEQYADTVMRQGPWTDLYALGGTMYYLITGEVPVAAASRALHDDQKRLAQQGARDCSQPLLVAIDWMLALRPAERPQSVPMLRDMLEGRITMPGRAGAERTAPGVAARAGTAADAPRTDIEVGADVGGPAAPPGAPTTGPGEGVHAPTLIQITAAPAAATLPPAVATVPTTPHAAAPVQPDPVSSAALASAGPALPPAQRFAGAAPRWLAALLLLNLVAWWWFSPPSELAPAASAQATGVLPATAPSSQNAPSAAAQASIEPPAAAVADAQPADAAASETVLSILPARPAPRRAGAAMPAPLGSGASSPLVAATKAAEPAAAPPLPRPRPALETAARSVPAPPALALQGPRERCGERNFLSMLICMKRECGDAALRSHPECVRLRQQEEVQYDRRQ